MRERKSARLSAQDWAAAALAALADGGLAAVAVEPIATRLDTTKGSFYWHFSNREALLEAALQLWETKATEDVIAAVQAERDARGRLRRLLILALAADHPGGNRVELALQATAGHVLVAPVLARVTERRLSYLGRLFSELGFAPGPARQRSLLAYTAYLGHAQFAHATPHRSPSGPALHRYVDDIVTILTAIPR